MPPVNFRLLRVLGCAALALSAVSGLVSCKTTESSPDYASNFGADGGFNPYPGQGAYAQPGTLLPAGASTSTSSSRSSHPQYAEAPPPPPPGYEVSSSTHAYTSPPVPGAASSSVKKSTTSSKPSTSTASKKTTTTPTKKPVTKKKPTASTYTVVKGDTLSAIARKKGTTVAKIKAANGMSSDFLSIGKKLKIP